MSHLANKNPLILFQVKEEIANFATLQSEPISYVVSLILYVKTHPSDCMTLRTEA